MIFSGHNKYEEHIHATQGHNTSSPFHGARREETENRAKHVDIKGISSYYGNISFQNENKWKCVHFCLFTIVNCGIHLKDMLRLGIINQQALQSMRRKVRRRRDMREEQLMGQVFSLNESCSEHVEVKYAANFLSKE